jgi:sugar/nucleoside kinase (ribokinase family)
MTLMNNKRPERILGVGNALVDIMIALENDELLLRFGLPRGSMTLVDSRLSAEIFEATRPLHQQMTTGGSAANTIHTLATLGAQCGYAGKISPDELGYLFEKEFHEKGITTHLKFNQTGTGRVMAMVSTDSERTMATYLGAAAELQPEDFTPEMMKSYDCLYVEGYLVQDHRLIETILKTGHELGIIIAIDLSSYNIVEQNRDFLNHLISHYTDIVFANEEEAQAYTGGTPEQAAAAIGKQCELAIVKTGKSGSLVCHQNKLLRIEPVPTTPVDTTGAGDSYSAGFLYGLSKGLSLEKCGQIASLVSSKAVETMGAKIPDHSWPAVLSKVDQIIKQ